MRKSELIERLQRIDGDPLVLVDVDGVLSDDLSPSLRTADERLIANIDGRTSARPAIGEPVILL